MVKVLLYLLLFFLPTQLGKHFWFDWSYKLGMRVDYLAPTVYFTDVLMVLIVALFVIQKYFTPGVKEKSPPRGWIICGFVGLLMVGWWLFVVGQNPWLLAYNLGRLGMLGMLGYVIAKTFKKEDFPQIVKVLNWALILQVFLAAYQVIVEKSADLWILGERSFSIITPGIARFTAPGGQLLLRGYGTFPHPNVLGGFCLLMLAANSFLFLGRKIGKRKINCHCEPDTYRAKQSQYFIAGDCFVVKTPRNDNMFFYLIGFIFSLFGIWLSMSILAIVLSQVFLVGIGVLVFGRTMRARHAAPLRLILLVIPVIILISGIWYLVAGNSDSISRRMVLLQYSWQMFKSSPVFGVGLGNFISAMPEKPVGSTYFWQPVHNIVVLVSTELGLVGIAIVSLLIWLGIKKSKVQSPSFGSGNSTLPIRPCSKPDPSAGRPKSKVKVQSLKLILIFWWGVIIITGLFDHYWLTLQQGRLMLVMVVGLSLMKK